MEKYDKFSKRRLSISRHLFKVTKLFLFFFFYMPYTLSSTETVDPRSIVVQTSNLGVLPWLPEASIDTQLVFSSAVFSALLNYDEHMNITPGIFTDFNWDKNKSAYHFKYNTKQMYHNGRKIDPADIEFAIIKLFLTDRKVVRKEIFNNILGVQDLKIGQKFKPRMVKGVYYDNKGNFFIKLKKANPRFLYSLANSVPGISPRDSFKKDLFSYKELPVGLGKYKVIKLDKKKIQIDLERVNHSECNSSHPCPNYVNFIETGDPVKNNVDVALFTSARPFYDNSDYKILVSSLPTSIISIDFNFKNEFSKKYHFRKAVSLAIQREDVCKKYKNFKPSHQLITSRTLGSTNKKFAFNPQKAKDIIQKKFGAVEIDAWFHGPKGHNNPDYVDIIQNQLEKINVKVSFSPTLKQGLESDQIALYVYGMSLDYSDPTLPLAMNLESKVRRFHIPQNKKILMNLYNNIKASKTPEREADSVQQMMNHLMGNYIQIPITQGYKVLAVKNNLKYPEIGYFSYSIDFDKILFK